MVEYLLSTETGEMQYETARCRPQLDEPFFAYLDSQVGESNLATYHSLWEMRVLLSGPASLQLLPAMNKLELKLHN